jgi:hypothetical protein
MSEFLRCLELLYSTRCFCFLAVPGLLALQSVLAAIRQEEQIAVFICVMHTILLIRITAPPPLLPVRRRLHSSHTIALVSKRVKLCRTAARRARALSVT